MSDCHSGKGCVIGTTMTITNKIVPNLVGVDIGCGMRAVKLANKHLDLPNLDSVIHKYVPAGFEIHEEAIATSGVDFQNMLNALKQSYKLQSTDKAYICYAVDLVNSIIYFEAFEAVDLKGARNTACTYLSNTLGEKVLVKNLQLNANKNSKVAHANNLANAYIGRLNEMNKYGTYSKYLVGCVKLSSGLIHTQILDDWVYQCY